MPALCRLTDQGCLESVRILGVGRSPMSDDEFQALVHEALEDSKKIEHLDEETWREFSNAPALHVGRARRLNTRTSNIAERLEELANEGASRNHLFYLATPPSLFSTIVKHLGEAGLRTKTATGAASSSKNLSAAISNRRKR